MKIVAVVGYLSLPERTQIIRGGYRTVHYCAANDVPVVLLALINKGERSDLSKSEQNELKKAMADYARNIGQE